MTVETCPHCGHTFDGRKHRYAGSWPGFFFRPQWPSEQIDNQFTVRCPHCRIAYVSDTVKFLGLADRKTYLLFWLLAIAALALVTSLA